MRKIKFLVLSVLGTTSLWGGDFTVTTNADGGVGSLRQAIIALNTLADEENTITFNAGLGAITLLSNLPIINQPVTFFTPSVADSLVIDGSAGPYRVLGGTLPGTFVTIDFSSSNTLTLSGLVDGDLSLEATGPGGSSLILNGINTYNRSTQLHAGVLVELSGTGSLPNLIPLVVNDTATLDISAITAPSMQISFLSGVNIDTKIILGSKELIVNFDGGNPSIYSGGISGTGSFTKLGTGTQALIGANTYSGGTTVSAGALQGSTTSLQGNILNNASVVFDQAAAGTYAGVISGTGALTKQNIGALILTGANTYSGGTTVSAGALQGSTTSLQGNILNNASVVFDQAAAGTYAGVISGTGALSKQGNGVLTFTNDSSSFSAGTVTINTGTLLVNGMLGGTLTVFSNAVLGGDGTVVGNVTNNGSIQPGNSIGTLTINGNYTQNASGELVIEINEAGATDLLNISPYAGAVLSYNFLSSWNAL